MGRFFREPYICKEVEGRTCPICLNRLRKTPIVVLKSCLHAYCADCITKWSQIKRRCPLCNADFHSWFFRLSPHLTFRHHLLNPLKDRKSIVPRTADQFLSRPASGSTTRPLARQRTFGIGDTFERKLRWRENVYRNGLRAVQPSNLKPRRSKEAILKRVEPWIRRELIALLHDPDPTIIVHLVSSILVDVELGDCNCVVANTLIPLRRFLRDSTDAFWHELTCFARSSLTIEAYDMVVVYNSV